MLLAKDGVETVQTRTSFCAPVYPPSNMLLWLQWTSLLLFGFTAEANVTTATDDDPTDTLRVLVGVVMPKYAGSNIHTYKICQDLLLCVPGVPVSTFDSIFKQTSQSITPVSQNTHNILYSDVTEIVDSQNWDPDRVWAEMTSNLVKGIPEPLVIVKNITNGLTRNSVTLGPKQWRKDYGDLLNPFTLFLTPKHCQFKGC